MIEEKKKCITCSEEQIFNNFCFINPSSQKKREQCKNCDLQERLKNILKIEDYNLENLKKCKKCKINKKLDNFYFNSQSGTFRAECKKCIREKNIINYNNNSEKRLETNRKSQEKNKEKNKEKQKIYREENKELIVKKKKENYNKNRKNILAKQKIYNSSPERKAIRNAKRRERRKNDPAHRLAHYMSVEVNTVLKTNKGNKAGRKLFDHLPYSREEIKAHIQALFEPWMNWDNQGRFIPKEWDEDNSSTWKWQLDHIIPVADLPHDSMEHENFQKCWALSNLRPYSAKQNVLDGTGRVRHRKTIND